MIQNKMDNKKSDTFLSERTEDWTKTRTCFLHNFTTSDHLICFQPDGEMKEDVDCRVV